MGRDLAYYDINQVFQGTKEVRFVIEFSLFKEDSDPTRSLGYIKKFDQPHVFSLLGSLFQRIILLT